jgi:hypothetical protein
VDGTSPECETTVCLFNHFQGRVTCPYGQTSEQLGQGDPSDPSVLETPGDWGDRCRIPGTDGTRPEDRVAVPVLPQLYNRRASEAVYCSCRCANAAGETDDGHSYCECPDEYRCVAVLPDFGIGNDELIGSYCIRRGTEYDPNEVEADLTCVLDRDYPGGWQEHPYECGEPIPY